MWPFKRSKIPTVTSAPSEGELSELSKLALRVEEMRAENAALRREWADTLDKLQTWFGRQAARKRQQLHRSLEQEAAENDAGDTNTPPPGVGGPALTKADLRRLAASRRVINGGGA